VQNEFKTLFLFRGSFGSAHCVLRSVQASSRRFRGLSLRYADL